MGCEESRGSLNGGVDSRQVAVAHRIVPSDNDMKIWIRVAFMPRVRESPNLTTNCIVQVANVRFHECLVGAGVVKFHVEERIGPGVAATISFFLINEFNKMIGSAYSQLYCNLI